MEEAKTLYLVTERGVYRHRIMGVYATQEQAERRAKEISDAGDGYHSYDVNSVELGQPCDDAEFICSFRLVE